MKKYAEFMFILLGCMCATFSYGQEELAGKSKGFDKSKLFVGGNFGLSFGNYTFINVSPQLGYRFNQYLAAGAGVNFIYSSLKTEYTSGVTASRQNQGVAGLNIFGRVYPIQYVFLQAQPEMNYTWGNVKEYGPPDVTYKLDGKIVPSLLLGGGGAIPSGGGAFIIMVQYDVLQNPRAPYGTKPFFSFGYNFGL